MSEELKVILSAFEVEWLMVTLSEMDNPTARAVHDKLHPVLYEYKMELEDSKI